jgi:hypothetical protein
MINKKILHVALIMTLSLVGFTGTAHAVVDVAVAKIERIGPDPRFTNASSSGVMVQLTDTSANPAWPGVRQFYLSAELGNTGVATLLTAFSLGEFVWVRIGGAAESGSLISIIFVNAPAP